MLDPATVRKDVERVLDRYLAIEYHGVEAIAGKLVGDTPPPSGETTVATDRPAQLWKSTIAAKLGHLPVRHQKALVGAVLNRWRTIECRRAADDVAYILSSPTGSAAIRSARPQVTDLRDVYRGLAKLFSSRRNRTIRGALYREAVLLFWAQITETPEIKAYCLGEDA